MSSTGSSELKIDNQNVRTSPGVTLSEQQKTLVGSVLDLFAGRPSLAKLQLWKDDGEFVDPLCIAKGRKQYEAQWYGLQAAFSTIEQQHQEVTNAGNPIEMDMKARYVVKGINKEQVIESKVLIHTDGDKIAKVEDKWNGTLPDSSIANVSSALQLLNPLWWFKYAEGWAFWCWSFTWETLPWKVWAFFSFPLPFLFDFGSYGQTADSFFEHRLSDVSMQSRRQTSWACRRLQRRMLRRATERAGQFDSTSMTYDLANMAFAFMYHNFSKERVDSHLRAHFFPVPRTTYLLEQAPFHCSQGLAYAFR